MNRNASSSLRLLLSLIFISLLDRERGDSLLSSSLHRVFPSLSFHIMPLFTPWSLWLLPIRRYKSNSVSILSSFNPSLPSSIWTLLAPSLFYLNFLLHLSLFCFFSFYSVRVFDGMLLRRKSVIHTNTGLHNQNVCITLIDIFPSQLNSYTTQLARSDMAASCRLYFFHVITGLV